MIRLWIRKIKQHDYLLMFCLCFATAGLTFIPELVIHKGLFSLVGDFNYQQIPFNILSNRAFKTGDLFWNWSTDLGSNFIGSYSFYTLGSPFFWLSLLFPPMFFQYLVGPLFLLKYCVAGMAAFAYLRRYVRDSRYAMIGALLYAFSGFSTVNLMFNHFHDVVAFFPLLLVGLDRLVLDKRSGWFAAAVAINATVNFFFFMGEVVFLLLYFCVRFLAEDFKKSLRRLPKTFFEGLLGIGMACILFLPAVYFTLQNPRLDQWLYGPSALTFDGSRYLEIIKAVLMPADIMPHQSAIYLSDFTSSGAYLPLFGPVAVVAFVIAAKRSWQRRLILILAAMACVPLLNSFFYLLNASYYARWFYMPVLIMSLMTAQVLENRARYPIGKALIGTGMANALLAAFLLFYPWSLSEKSAVFQMNQFNFYLCTTTAGLIASYYLLHRFSAIRHWWRWATGLVMVFAAGLALFNIVAMHAIYDYQSPEAIDDTVVKTGQQLAKVLPKSENYRISISDGGWNLAMVSATPTVNSFTSMVNGSIFQFYQSIGAPRAVKTIVPDSYYGLIPFLSNRYYVTTVPMSGKKLYAHFYNGYNTIYIYENKDVLPIGFTYKYYLTEKQFSKVPILNRHLVLLKAVIIPQSEVKTVAGLLEPLPQTQLTNQIGGKYYHQDIVARRAETASDFHRSNKGFSANLRVDQPKYVFFSVPYDKGWRATVNGLSVKIINADGFMIVPVTTGNNRIQFTYQTPGLTAGILVSAVSLLLFTGYVSHSAFLRKRRKQLGIKDAAHLDHAKKF
ncbi:YfhO family protein [Sporolactobacillus spathodeae]|uniref:Membrane protein YfhO n=1 Tax=Sporolactobacillus spathodeae TaxID=1465502 RepID=A0ABS2QDH8_9BACL|nr:YfhO family protein [Sporolactobacillus spathodeae]MBM7659199.1 putative membrane protein YfhO [Sporolactobacillus spathodeae]